MRPLAPLAAALLVTSCAAPGGDTAPAPLEIRAGALRFDAVAAGPEDGELVLMLHGFPQTSHSFRNQVPVLAEAGYRVVAFDQRGYSPLARPSGVEAYAIPHLVSDVVAVADALGRDRFHVVGHDWGAAVAWFTAMIHPERVLTVAALSVPHPMAFSRAMADPTGDQAQRSAYMEDLRGDDAAAVLLANDAALLRSVYTEAVDAAAVDRYVACLGTEEALGAALNWYRAMGARVPYPPLTRIRMPALYVWSTADSTMGREGAELTAEYVDGPYRFEVLEGVGHWIPEEAAEAVSEMLLEHLDTSATGDPSGSLADRR